MVDWVVSPSFRRSRKYEHQASTSLPQNLTFFQSNFPGNGILYIGTVLKIGTRCVHVSAIWKFNDHVGKKVTHASRMKDNCVLSP